MPRNYIHCSLHTILIYATVYFCKIDKSHPPSFLLYPSVNIYVNIILYKEGRRQPDFPALCNKSVYVIVKKLYRIVPIHPSISQCHSINLFLQLNRQLSCVNSPFPVLSNCRWRIDTALVIQS